MPHQRLIDLFYMLMANNGFFRNNQNMHRSLCINIIKGDTKIVFIVNISRDFLINNFLKNGENNSSPFYIFSRFFFGIAANFSNNNDLLSFQSFNRFLTFSSESPTISSITTTCFLFKFSATFSWE